jgi:hypothetical protein
MRAFSDSGTVRTKAIIIQAVIVAGVLAWFKVCLPRIERAQAASEAREREKRIEAFFQSIVADDPSREIEVPEANGEKRHPQRLRRAASVEEVEQALGAPDSRTSDFREGLHLTWTGDAHKLEASFTNARLYCLRREDRRTGHGTMVFESGWYWAVF